MIAILLLGLTLQSAPSLPPAGPYVRTETLVQRPRADLLEGNDYYFVHDGLRRIEFPSRTVWENRGAEAEEIFRLMPHEKWILGGVPDGVTAFSRSDGKAAWTVSTEDAYLLDLVGDLLILATDDGGAKAVNVLTQKAAWTHKLPVGDEAMEAYGNSASVVIWTTSEKVICLDAKTGKQRWIKQATQSYPAAEVANGVHVIGSAGKLTAFDLETGKELWQKPSSSLTATPTGFLSFDGKSLDRISPRTGAEDWKVDVTPFGSFESALEPRLFGTQILISRSEDMVAIDRESHEAKLLLWQQSVGRFLWSDGQSVVVKQMGVMVMKPGVYPPLPEPKEERIALARHLATNLLDLSSQEIERLKELGDDAFPVILEEFLRLRSRLDEGVPTKQTLDASPALGTLLVDLAGPQHGDKFVSLYQTLPQKSSARPLISRLYALYADPSITIPPFIATLKKEETLDRLSQEGQLALETVSRSSAPEAVDYLISALKNPRVSDEIRNDAYVHLARTGGEKGRAAVLQVRRRKVDALPSLEARMNLASASNRTAQADNTVVAEHRDKQGRGWGLVLNSVLGNRSDLFLVEKVGGEWMNPVFTGLSAEPPSNWVDGAQPATLDGKTGAQMLQADWPSAIIGRAELASDRDRDGYTDLVEARLGTDPDQSDSDGDGRKDSEDAFPLTAGRGLTEEEQILAAAYETHYRFNSWSKNSSPAILSMGEYRKPFELPGWPGPIIWSSKGPQNMLETRLAEGYEKGLALIRCEVVKRENDKATVELSTYLGGLYGAGWMIELQKFGEEWFVINQTLAYES